MAFSDLLVRLADYDRVADIGGIARRYVAMNGFDGIVTIIGVISGSWAAGIEDPRIVVTTGASTALAMSVSGVWGAWLSESAERRREVRMLERHMMTDLGNTRIGRASRAAVIVVVLVEAVSPLLAAFIPLLPFLFADALPGLPWAYGLAAGLALLTLLGVGVFLGRVSQQGVAGFALKTVLAGLVALGIGLLM